MNRQSEASKTASLEPEGSGQKAETVVFRQDGPVVSVDAEMLTLVPATELSLQQQARYQAELLSAGPAAARFDAKGCLVFANSAFQSVVQRLRLDEDGEEKLAALVPQVSPDSLRNLSEALGDTVSREFSVTLEGGQQEFFSAQYRVVGGQATSETGIVCTLWPITGLRAARHVLAMAGERLDDIARLVSDWLWETDQDLSLTYVSERVTQVLGYQAKGLIGQNLLDLINQPPEILQLLRDPSGRNPFDDIEVEMPSLDGSRRLFQLSGLPVYSREDGRFIGFRGTANDVTELRSRELALVRAKEVAELANRAKSEFLANISHELRTPLNAVIGFSEVISSQAFGPVGNPQYREYADDILNSARHLLRIINDLLDIARIEAGKMELYETEVSALDVGAAVLSVIAEQADRVGLTLDSDLPEDLPCFVADEGRIKQVLLNLLSNAVKFTEKGGHIELFACVDANGYFVFCVKDTGIGIAAEDISAALAPFEQVESQLTRRFEGTGLGLALSRELIELHGGELEIDSELGRGTTVKVSLPPSRVLATEP